MRADELQRSVMVFGGPRDGDRLTIREDVHEVLVVCNPETGDEEVLAVSWATETADLPTAESYISYVRYRVEAIGFRMADGTFKMKVPWSHLTTRSARWRRSSTGCSTSPTPPSSTRQRVGSHHNPSPGGNAMTKTEILDHLRDVLTHIESALGIDPGNEHLAAAKDSLANATAAVATLGPASNGVEDVEPDPDALSANPGATDNLIDTSGNPTDVTVTDPGPATDQEDHADPGTEAPSA